MKKESMTLSYCSPVLNGYGIGYTVGSDANTRSLVVVNSNGTIIYRFPTDFDIKIVESAGDYYGGIDPVIYHNWSSGEYWAYGYAEGLITIYRNDSSGRNIDVSFYDINGHEVINLSGYTNAGIFSEGLVNVQKDGKWGYVDKTGTTIIPCQYSSTGLFHDGLAAVKDTSGAWGFIDKTGKTVIPCKYDDYGGAGEGFISVKYDGKWGFVDYDDNTVLSFEYDELTPFENGVAYGIKDGYVSIINKKDSGNESDKHTHTLVKTPAKSATYDDAGNSEYWTCLSCGKYFSNSAGTKEISKNSWVTPKLTKPVTGGTTAQQKSQTTIAQQKTQITPAAKKAQPMKVTVAKKTVKFAKVKKKAQVVKAITVKKAQGKVNYKLVGGNAKSKKALKLNTKNGKITVRKKTKKGTYKIKVKVTAAGNTSYKSAAKTMTVTIKVK